MVYWFAQMYDNATGLNVEEAKGKFRNNVVFENTNVAVWLHGGVRGLLGSDVRGLV